MWHMNGNAMLFFKYAFEEEGKISTDKGKDERKNWKMERSLSSDEKNGHHMCLIFFKELLTEPLAKILIFLITV